MKLDMADEDDVVVFCTVPWCTGGIFTHAQFNLTHTEKSVEIEDLALFIIGGRYTDSISESESRLGKLGLLIDGVAT